MGVTRCATALRAQPGMGEVIPERRNQVYSLSLHKAIANKLYGQLTSAPPPPPTGPTARTSLKPTDAGGNA